MEQSKNRKIILAIIGITIIIIGLVGISYAFFNYTRTGSSNTISVGKINFNTSGPSNQVSLTNVVPISSSEVLTDENNVAVLNIDISGDTEYEKGIEYLVSAVDVNNTTNNIEVPISIMVTYNEKSNKVIGEEDDSYFANRGSDTSIYKILGANKISEDTSLLVGYIKQDTVGIDGTITIRAYIDSNDIIVSDTFNGQTDKCVLTTNEWNSLQGNNGLSFKVKVEARAGVWVEEPLTLSQSIARQVSTASYIASYDDIITQNPTFTTQDQVSTSAPKQTVYYFTGDDAAANANVLFAGYCWQIIRTTDNGGVRMIYNGVAVNNKCETTRTATKGINADGNGTAQSMSAATLYGRSYDYDLERGEFTIENSTGLPTSWTTNDNNSNGTADYKELIGTYTCLSSSSTCSTLYYVGSINQSNTAQAYVAKYTIGDVAHFSQLGTSAFNSNYRSPALVGYMFNTEYDYNRDSKSDEYFANAVWENGAYTLSNGNGGSAPDATHHYICDSDCTKVRYYYYVSSSNYYYILLENGMTIEDVLYQMTGYGNATILSKSINANYKLNNYNSAIKGYLDNWYKKNLTGYTSYLDESSVYCNDRSIRDLGGWNPSGTSLNGSLQFKQYSVNRDLNCVNENDRFSVTNNKAQLTYPIGLLTEPERNLMTDNFAKTGQDYWGASPYYFGSSARVRVVYTRGDNSDGTVSGSRGVRVVISLKPGTELDSGSGTYTDPYIVGPIVTREN